MLPKNDNMWKAFIYSIIFYIASICERNSIKQKPFRKPTLPWVSSTEKDEDVLGPMDLLKGYLFYMGIAIWFVVLLMANNNGADE